MLFNSVEFLFLFLPAVLVVFWLLKDARNRFRWLTIASYVFYGYWDYRFCTLMLASTILDYWCGKYIATSRNAAARKWLLAASLIGNLGMLGFFKYCDFFLENLNTIASSLGAASSIPLLKIILPVGISFYTFQSLSYTIDVYRGLTRPAPSFSHFACFVSLFPQLVAGPIVRYTEIADQLEHIPPRPTWAHFSSGIWLFTMGLAKKILIADTVARMSDPLLANVEGLSFFTSWAAVLGYTFQIYFDFSGYSDMAAGLGHMLGLRLPQNFDSPYQAVNVSDFWRRWHISLSSWLRDYLFIPLGGSREGRGKTFRNLVVTMFLGGLWHGAHWVFVLWGLYHGLFLVLHALCAHRGWTPRSVALNRVGTFIVVAGGWAIFRSSNVEMLATLYSNMLGLAGFESIGTFLSIAGPRLPVVLAVCLLWTFFAPNTWQYRPKPTLWTAAILGVIFGLCLMSLSAPSPFLYFQF